MQVGLSAARSGQHVFRRGTCVAASTCMRTWLGLLVASALSSTVVAQAPPLFSARSDLVVLHVAVTARGGTYVSGLTRESFLVYEDNVPQEVVLFSAEDAPATVGMIIDDSASMFGLRDLVTAGAARFAATSNPADEIFALTFNEHVRPVLPPQLPFTSDAEVLREQLRRAIDTRGKTALYDAVAAGVEHLQRGVHPRKALVLLSDGGDNASTTTLDAMVDAAASTNTVIYTIALRDPADPYARPGLLKRLAHASGGLAFEPKNPAHVGEAFERIARDIRAGYSVAYAPPSGPAGVRRVRVTASGPDGASLQARTRQEYVATR